MSDQTQKPLPLTVSLHKSLPQLAALLGETFQFDPEMMTQIAGSVRSYGTLLKWLGIANGHAERNFGLRLRISKKLTRNGGLGGFILYVRRGETSIMSYEIDPDSVVFNARGLYLNRNDDTATRADIEAFQLHLREVGCEKFFRSALQAYGRPKQGRAKEAYQRAMAVLDEALSERVVQRNKLNVEAKKFQQFLETLFGSYQNVRQQTEILCADGVTATGQKVSDPRAVRYTGEAFTLEVAADYAQLHFAFGTICAGKGCQQFKPEALVQAIRKAGDPSHYIATTMKAIIAFEAFSAGCETAENTRRRVLRLMCSQPVACAG